MEANFSQDTCKICSVAHISNSLAFLAFLYFREDSLYRSSYDLYVLKKSNLETFCCGNETAKF